jgi:hypothetical protein
MRGGWPLLARCALASATCAFVSASPAFADEKSPPPAARPNGSAEPYWLSYAAFRNDVFTELDPPIDDVGFTHDNVFALRRQAGRDTIGGSFVHRFITSRVDRRRWDLVELFATGERVLIEPAPLPEPTSAPTSAAPTSATPSRIPLSISATLRAGPTLGGNWGGRYMQNAFHALTKFGPTVDEGLANDYPSEREIGLVVGGRARASVSRDRSPQRGPATEAYSFVDGQVAIGGSGVTSMQTAIGGNLASAHVGAHLELAVARYHVGDPNLALPGAYRSGWQFEWRVGVDVHWSRFRLGFEYRANESGSGEPMGLFEVSTTR